MAYFWLALFVGVLYLLSQKQKQVQRGRSKPAFQNTLPSPDAGSQETDDDAWEGWFYDAKGPQRSAAKTVRISYSDASGKQSERVVNIRAFESAGKEGLIIAHCHLRNATRTFRFDRMRRVVDEDTGEIIADLQKHLNDEWLATPQPVVDKLYEQHHDVLKMMLFMAKADGAMRAAELEVIAKCCVDITQDDRITVAMIKEMLGCVDVVSLNTFVRTYNHLRREKPASAVLAAAACRAIVATQKKIHPNEQAALDALDKPLPALKAVS